MIKIEKTEVVGLEPAIRGMRNPKNSWDRSDSRFDLYCDDIQCDDCPSCGISDCVGDLILRNGSDIGPNDRKLMCDLAAGGPVHAKYRRMIVVYVDITAPLYWWKEFDTYKVGTVANSCSTMHKIHSKPFTLEDFSHEHLNDGDIDIDIPLPNNKDAWEKKNIYIGYDDETGYMGLAVPFSESRIDGFYFSPSKVLENFIIPVLNANREAFLKTNDKRFWWQMIQLLPSSYNQKRTIMLNYEVLVGMYKWRKNHKLDEWRELCKWIESLPYSELITEYV